MKTFLQLTCLLLFFSFQAQKPNLVWAKPHGTKVLSQTTVLDKLGNVYIGGFAQDTVDFDPGPGTATLAFSQNAFVAKYRANGTLVWVRPLGVDFVQVPIELCIDGQMNVYVCGTFYGGSDFDWGPSVYSLTANNADIAIIKMDSLSNFIWAGVVGSPEFEYASELKVDGLDNLYLSGSGGSNMFPVALDLDPGPNVSGDTIERYSDGFMLKVSPTGVFQWSKTWGSWAYEYIHGFDVDASGNLLITGHCISGMDMDPGPLTVPAPGNPGKSWTFLQKINFNGSLLWTRYWEAGQGNAEVTSDKGGNIILLASFYGTVDLDPGASSQLASSWKWLDAYVVKMNSSGQFIWGRSWHDSDYIYSGVVHTDHQNNIYVTGMSGATIDFDPGIGVDTLSDMKSHIIKLDPNGNYKWAAAFPMESTISRPSVVTYTTGELYAAVWYAGVADLDPGNGVTPDGVATKHSSALIKLNESEIITGIDNNFVNQSALHLAPNPATSQFYLSSSDLMVIECNSRGRFIVRDTQGKIVTETAEASACDPFQINLAPGIYFCTWSGDYSTYKLILHAK